MRSHLNAQRNIEDVDTRGLYAVVKGQQHHTGVVEFHADTQMVPRYQRGPQTRVSQSLLGSEVYVEIDPRLLPRREDGTCQVALLPRPQVFLEPLKPVRRRS